MKRNVTLALQITFVFVGTIVGAGLASGQEINQFFTRYGYKSIYGICLCCLIYIIMSYMIISLSIRHRLNSYNELINLVIRPKILGQVTDAITSLFLISGAAIILAGSGSLLHQYFGFSKWVGIILMVVISLFILLRDTKGLIEVNSFIVPSLIIVIVTVFILHIFFSRDIVSITTLKNIPSTKNNWLFSCILYSGFNILGCSGVLVPLSSEFRNRKSLTFGAVLGAIILTVLTMMINIMLLLNVPYISKYEIPLLYIANRFGTAIQIMLLCIIWLEMFSTEVSDIYSVGKTMQQIFNISYKKSVVIIMAIAIPISQIGFVNLISILYPFFGFISLIFMVQCIIFFIKNRK
ncbi:YkvI family membrane protein [Clostridium omnivorum]|uniref:Transporter n=1 Tax=Clostridium omnivorum TaxID=1604902 RepID=A0ABQ5N468_9CLOT|nr:transporter [Clostridium sp. E14]GLC30007.1 transporter [Clostridium sp. E14]